MTFWHNEVDSLLRHKYDNASQTRLESKSNQRCAYARRGSQFACGISIPLSKGSRRVQKQTIDETLSPRDLNSWCPASLQTAFQTKSLEREQARNANGAGAIQAPKNDNCFCKQKQHPLLRHSAPPSKGDLDATSLRGIFASPFSPPLSRCLPL